MGGGNWGGPEGMGPRWRGRRGPGAFAPERGGASTYLKVVVVILAAILVGIFAWQEFGKYFRPAERPADGDLTPPGKPYAADAGASDSAARAWQADFSSAIASAADEGKSGDVTSSEMETDRGASILTSAWEKGLGAPPNFFETALGQLNAIVATHPESDRLADHVFQAKIALAELRSGIGAGAAESQPVEVGAGTAAAGSQSAAAGKHVVFDSPRAITAKQSVDGATFGGNYIDATVMPHTAEVLLPPATRAIEDDVRVTGLTIEGASQTLDGVTWKDVTFIGTRLRYEGGGTSLKNVKFVRCTFGFSDDEGGTKLVEAVARGEGTVSVKKSVSEDRIGVEPEKTE
ncbi:MAG: hypothetical protein WA823_15850 [Candidatus Acidiferrales bacterium]